MSNKVVFIGVGFLVFIIIIVLFLILLGIL